MKSRTSLVLLITFGILQQPAPPAAARQKHRDAPASSAAHTSEYYFARAREHSRRGKHAEAIVDLDCALTLSPGNHDYLDFKAFELNRLERFAESEQLHAISTAIQHDSKRRWTDAVLKTCNRKKICL